MRSNNSLRTIARVCKHGTFTFFADDEFVGASLNRYGDYSEDEVCMFQKLLTEDDTCIEVGANIGALTVPMAKVCKKVYAIEPQTQNYDLLKFNVERNELQDKVRLINAAVGDTNDSIKVPTLLELNHRNFGAVEVGEGSEYARLYTLDRLCLIHTFPKIKLIKIDVEGYERKVLEGAEDLIARDRPLLYVENDRQEKSAELVGWLIDHNYRCYWHRSPLYIEQNFRGSTVNMFGNIHSHNMICIPEEAKAHVAGLEEVDDHRIDEHMYERERARALRRLEEKPDDLDAHVIAAHYSNLMNDEETAHRLLDQNLKRNPEHTASIAVKGLMQLQEGNYKDGWQAYELRYSQLNPQGFGWRPHTVPHWDGTTTDERVLIWCEQGFGDSIMFGRFMQDVLHRAPNAIFEVQPQLFELFESSGIVPEGRLFRLGRTLPEYRFHCSLPSVPAVLRFDSAQQLVRKPYLRVDQTMIDSWYKRKTPKIGICKHGGMASERGYSRNLPDECAEDLARRFGPFMTLTHEGQWESYADTAAAIMALDLVITVDTSVAHLAGALGAKTFLLLSTDPDWRWGKHSTDTPWYSTMTIFRQKKFMDWSSVVEQVSDTLETVLKVA